MINIMCTHSSFLKLFSVLVMILVKSEDLWLNSERNKTIVKYTLTLTRKIKINAYIIIIYYINYHIYIIYSILYILFSPANPWRVITQHSAASFRSALKTHLFQLSSQWFKVLPFHLVRVALMREQEGWREMARDCVCVCVCVRMHACMRVCVFVCRKSWSSAKSAVHSVLWSYINSLHYYYY